MKYTQLGRTGLRVSRLCLGTMNFGPETEEPDAYQIMEKAHDIGVNFFDTANQYGRSKGQGATEEIIGRWLGQGGGRRDRTVLATKLYVDMGAGPNVGRLSALNIRKACDASLRRLQTDYIDLYQMHHIDRETPWDEIWEAMDVLRHQGKIIYVGSSNFAGWHIAKAQEHARKRNLVGLVCEQSIYNLLCRDVELEVLPSVIDNGLGFLAWSPLYGGVLGGVVHRERDEWMTGWARPWVHLPDREKLEAFEDLCQEIGEHPATVALAWLLSRPGVTGPIVGPQNIEQLVGAERALDLDLSEDVLNRLDSIFPGHDPAPEDYAW